MLACHGPMFSNGELTIILTLLLGWLASLILVFVNLGLIVNMKMSRKPKFIHIGIFSAYLSLIILLFSSSLLNDFLIK